MKMKNILPLCLLLESALVLLSLLTGKNAWIGIVCYWSVVAMKNLLDFLDGRADADGKQND